VPIITSNISGYGSNSVIGISGSIVFQNPQIPGSDTVFFVSGSNSARAVFAGTMVVSGSLVTSGSIFLGDSTNEDILQVKATSFLLGPTAVGTTSTSSLLTVSGSSTPSTPTMVVREGVASPTEGVGVFNVQNSAGTSLLFVSGSGFVGIGTNAQSSALGSIFCVSSSLTGNAAASFEIGSQALGASVNVSKAFTHVFQGVAAASNEYMRINNLGNVGIGTGAYTGRLFVSGSSASTTPTMVVKEGIASPTGGAGTFDVQNSAGISLFFVSGSGNIGIGTTTPGEKLSVHDGGPDRIGLGVVNATATTTLYLGSKNSGAGYRTLQFNRTTGNLDLYYGNVGSAMTSALTVDLNGKIGIGTSGLTAPLNIFGTSTTTPSSTVGMVRFLGSATNALIFGTLTESPFSSYVQSGGSGTYPLSLNPLGGNVGIGTTTNLSTLSVNGSFSAKSPSTISAATYTVAATDYSLRFTTTNCTVTLPAASSFPGRILIMNTITANSVTSNTSNVIPLGSDTAGTAILAATLGKFTMIQSNGTNWVTLMSN